MSYLGGVNGLNLAENRIEYILLQPEIFSQRTSGLSQKLQLNGFKGGEPLEKKFTRS